MSYFFATLNFSGFRALWDLGHFTSQGVIEAVEFPSEWEHASFKSVYPDDAFCEINPGTLGSRVGNSWQVAINSASWRAIAIKSSQKRCTARSGS